MTASDSIDRFGIQVLQEVGSALEMRWWVDFGTCLGAVRDSNFIPWDRDVDISVKFKPFDSADAIDRLKKLDGIELNEHARTDGHVAGVHFTLHGVRGGVHFWNLEQEDYVYEATDHKLVIPEKFFQSFTPQKIRGYRVLIPSPPGPYLDFIYGPNWRTPNEKWLNSPEHLEARKRWMR